MKKLYVSVAFALIAGLASAGLGSALAQAQTYGSSSTPLASSGNSSTSTSGISNQTTTSSTNSTVSNSNQSTTKGSTANGTFSASGSITGMIFENAQISTTSSTTNGAPTAASNSTATAATGGLSTNNSTSMNANLNATTSSGTLSSANPTPTTNSTSTLSSPSNASALNSLPSNGTLPGSNSNSSAPTISPTPGTISNSTTSSGNTTTSSVSPTTSAPYILAGTWNLNAANGNVTSFSASFTMVHIDGTGRHTHDFKNFHAAPNISVSLSNLTEITGTADITKDGSVQWSNVTVVLMLQNYNVLNIAVSSNATDNHFQGQPIYGITNSLTDSHGTQLIKGATSATSISSIGQNVTQGASNLVNKTGNALSGIGQGIQKLFNGTKK